MLGLEAVHLQFNGHQTIEPPMKQQEVDCEVPTPTLHGIFGPDETEVVPELDKKFLQPRQQAAMKIILGVGHRQIKEFDKIGVLQNAVGSDAVDLSHHW